VPIYALEAIDDAVGPTRSLVSGLGIGGWLKLGAITVFVGGVGSVSFSANLPGELVDSLPGEFPGPADAGQVAGAIGLVVVLAAVLAAVSLVRSILEFAFYVALRDGAVSVRRAVGRWWLHGVQVWGFRVAVAWTLLAGGSGLASAISASGLSAAGVPNRVLVVGTVALAFGTYAVVSGFTTRFVIPVMLLRGAGVLSGWRRFLRTLAASPGQYLWYIVIGLFVRFVADVLALSAIVLVAVLLVVPVAVFVVPAVIVLEVRPDLALSPPLIMLTTGLSAGYVLAALMGAVLARLPFVVYVRYYAVTVLGCTDPPLDLLGNDPGAEH
jgi:hypothetical protein